MRAHDRRPCRPVGRGADADDAVHGRASISLERVGGESAVLRLGGELDVASLPALDRVLSRAERWAFPSLLVDAAAVAFVDLSVISWLIRGHARLEAQGGGLLIVHPPDCLLRILDVIDVDLPLLH